MTTQFTAADNVTAIPSSPLVEGVATELWSSPNLTNGTNFQHIKLNMVYHEINPGPDVGSNALVAVLYQLQDDGVFEEIGRQNQPLAKLEQGSRREIIVSSNSNREEGIDDVIAGFDGIPVKLKSFFDDEASGTLKVCVHVKENDKVNNPFVSARFSITGTRYG